MLREGTKKYTAATIAGKLDYYGSWLELSSSSDYAYITVYSLNKYVAETLEVVESMIKEPLFPEKELHTILDTNIQQYLVNTSKVDFLAHRSLLQSLYGEQHPCGKVVVEEDYHAITPEVLRNFYERYYHSGNCSIFLSGKVTEDIIRRVKDTFGSPFGQYQLQTSKLNFPYIAVPEKRIFTEREDAMQSAVKMGYTTITREHPDYLKLRVLMTVFGGYFGSRLMSNIREEKGYTYGISAGIMFYPDSGLLIVSTETDNEYVEPLIQEVYHEIDRLHQEVVPVGTVYGAQLYAWRNVQELRIGFFTVGCMDFYSYFRLGRRLFFTFFASCTGGYACRITRFGAALFVQREIKRGHSR